MKSTTMAVSQSPLMTGHVGDGQANLQPDILLACQVRPRNNLLHRSEWLLMWALLSDALHVLATFHPCKNRRNSKEKRQWEADRAWIRDCSEAPFSFVYVCDHLGLDREALRVHAERLIAGENISVQSQLQLD